MGIVNYIREDLIIPDLKSTEKISAVWQMIDLAVKQYPHLDADTLFLSYAKREREMTTGIGFEVAMPLVNTDAISDFIVVFAKSAQGVHYGSIDGLLVHLLFMILRRTDTSRKYLQLQAELANFLRMASNRDALMRGSVQQNLKLMQIFFKK